MKLAPPYQPPVFVVGTPRSGTTLTAEILGRHSQIFMPGENHFFEDIYARRGELGDMQDPRVRAQVVERLLGIYGRFNQMDDQRRVDALFADRHQQGVLLAAESYRSLLERFMQIQLLESGKLRWGNNTPKDIFHLEAILEFYPRATVVVCMRDVRDFLLSYKNRWRVSAHGDRLARLYHPLTTALLWRATMSRLKWIHGNVPAGQLCIVRYEELVADPEPVARRLCGVLGVDFEPDMLQVGSNNSSRGVSGATGDTGIFTSSVGQWQAGGLTPEEICLAQLAAGATLQQAGYVPSRTDARPLGVLRLVLSFPLAVTRALWANRAHRGPTLSYLWRRLASLLGRHA